ncbi:MULTISPECIES: DNA helicase PcrA [unclassified Candidatus Frackibacter]|uniref:DNA helicase PcrA n=1 Tax=unclassified Candidatus Frackibacter TaxID=2648818 RepID=UPI00079676E2|nr:MULTISPECIES: DNA helicase PcrA [unclassified Candidatus Frackibacter]KXS44478.1 MAG: DNA helicase II / ATP-dependent DNA helicase PcrA [Candidatus Frackibacter sp. T328-2]SDC77746.1 DNA helicase-2 / ATP-dependent DNA helicase PcrA [Candidatus Frackibacter sp. WG11]SFL99961.1 DNA helicase-2 / ATP-dependent DNA helicase PcrA [Candidatus Frackibacter sp. WG13]
MELLRGLNPQQKEAVQYVEGPLLVLAGAGSGKTRVLTHRIAYLIQEKGVDPYNILAVTFTNKAASEMQERIEKLIAKDSEALWMSTFHSIAVRILRREANKLGYDNNFVIYDTTDQKSVIKDIIKNELDLDTKQFKPRSILNQISNAKNELVDVDTYQERVGSYFERIVGEVYELYQTRLKNNNAFDFDDLIMKTVELFSEYELVLEYYQERFKYILIDEYQDVNHAQYKLVNLLAREYQNICVVGDDDQGIYGFRGADISNILNFEKDYPDVKVVKLEQNYRSTEKILDAAFYVVRNNQGRKPKKLWTDNVGGEPLQLYKAHNEREEAQYIAKEILKNRANGDLDYSDFAILYRTNAQSRVLEDVLIKEGIPYRMVGGLKFYDRKEIKDILGYLRLIYNPADDVSLQRIINVPKRGVGATTVQRLNEFANDNNISLYEAVQRVDEISTISSRFSAKVSKFGAIISYLRQQADEVDALELARKLLDETGYLRMLQEEGTDQARSRVENIKELLTVIEEYVNEGDDTSIGGFLEEVALVADIDNLEDDADAIIMMTLHSAKGLEFPVVFLSGMEEGLFPHSRSLDATEDIEEERRLCYVGMTRAEEKLYLTHAVARRVYGKDSYNPPSRFLSEIPDDLFANQKKESQKKKLNKEEKSSKENSEKEYQVGEEVEHPKWGLGRIVSTTSSGKDLQVSVAFPNKGVKKLLVDYAPLKKVN